MDPITKEYLRKPNTEYFNKIDVDETKYEFFK